MSKTVKQIADEIGVSKQAIFKRIKKEPLLTSLQQFTSTVDGVVYIKVDGVNLIKQAFNKTIPPTNDNKLSPAVDGIVDGKVIVIEKQKQQEEISFLRSQVEYLQGELEKEREHNREKDKQLLDTLAKLADSQAHLVAGQTADKQKALVEKMVEVKEQQEEIIIGDIEKEKKGFFQRIFMKN